MKVYILGSNAFMNEMVDYKNQLCALGYDAWLGPDYEAYARGEKKEDLEKLAHGENAQVKRDNNYFKLHYKHILESDAVLVINLEKNKIENYIGGNVLIEMGQAYVHDKKIFLLNALPKNLSYSDEIEAMDPVCLFGDLSRIQ